MDSKLRPQLGSDVAGELFKEGNDRSAKFIDQDWHRWVEQPMGFGCSGVAFYSNTHVIATTLQESTCDATRPTRKPDSGRNAARL